MQKRKDPLFPPRGHRFKSAVWKLPDHKAQTNYRNIILEIIVQYIGPFSNFVLRYVSQSTCNFSGSSTTESGGVTQPCVAPITASAEASPPATAGVNAADIVSVYSGKEREKSLILYFCSCFWTSESNLLRRLFRPLHLCVSLLLLLKRKVFTSSFFYYMCLPLGVGVKKVKERTLNSYENRMVF